MASIDYYAIQEGLQTLLREQISWPAGAAKNVFIEGMEREIALLSNMPLFNIRLTSSDETQVSIPDGSYEYVQYAIDVIVLDLSEFKKAARLRDQLLGNAKALIRANRKLFNAVETLRVTGNTTFSTYSGDAGAHVAFATFGVQVEAYIDSPQA